MQHKKSIHFNVMWDKYFIIPLLLLTLTSLSFAQDRPDLSKDKTLYVVGTAHLDTQWRWTVKTTINDYIKKTLDDNFSRFQQYPNYNFSFEGPFRYMLMKEYYPDRYDTLSDYIDQGRWHVAGTTLENGDMNIVSPESLIRQALIGNNFFEDEFNKRSTDIYLPDCFGFSYTMPTWGAHCGINGFSSQKLSWGGAVPTPFNVGVWKGPDGSSIIAALNPGAYTSNIDKDLSEDSGWLNRINSTGNNYGVFADYMYFGTGDTGGAPGSSSCDWLEQSIAGTGPINVLSAGSDDLYNDITPAQKENLPVYDGELLMRIHGTGCYTSQAAMKRWNRQNELLADSTERASVMAAWMGSAGYPQDTLDEAWIRFLWHSFHDDLPGTSIPEAYEISWNDEILAQNQFESILNHGVGSIAQALDTQTDGIPVIVYNPLGIERADITEATVVYETAPPDNIKIFDNQNNEIPSQIISRSDNSLTVAFLAEVPSVGFKVFDVRPSEQPGSQDTGLNITTSSLENIFYIVTIDQNGDISSIWDKINSKEVLSAPSRLELLSNYSPSWPAWEVRYDDIQQPPYGYVAGPVNFKIIENGPARITLQITRSYGITDKSTFIQNISLTAGDAGDQITIQNKIDWRTQGTLLKASFPLTSSNSTATYDLGMGTIQRSNNHSSTYEVPAQQWADITDQNDSYGVSILNDCRYGWDKPADNILRLTLLHTPSVNTSYTDQSTQDLGQHMFTYAIAPHAGTWQSDNIPQQAARINQPLITYQPNKHSGNLGKEYSFLQINTPQVFVKAIKKAQRAGELIVRFQELYGSDVSNIQVAVGNGISSAKEVNGCEQEISSATVTDGLLEFNMTKYQPKTFSLIINPSNANVSGTSCTQVNIPYNMDAFSWDSNRSDGDFVDGLTYSAELISDTLNINDIIYNIGSRSNGQNNAMACTGQVINIGTDNYESLYILAASRNGDTEVEFDIAGNPVPLSIQDYHENIVDWGREEDAPYLKRDTIGWVGTHRHSSGGNQAYEFCYMFQYKLDLPAGTESITLPDNDNIVIFAMSLANVPANQTQPAVEIIDILPYIPELAPKPETRKNLALNKPVYADGYISGENPENIVDGTTADNSKWCVSGSSGQEHWLVVDLGQEYDIDTLVLRHAGDGGETSTWNTSDYSIQTSSDGSSSWSDLVSITGNTQNVSRHSISPTTVRYLRLLVAKPAQDDNSAVRIYEFEVYGPCDGTWIQGDVSSVTGVSDCRVDLYDMQTLAAEWLLCNAPGDTDCYVYWLERFPDNTSDATYETSTDTLPEDSLVAYWKVQEGSGQTLHDLTETDDYGSLLGSTIPSWQTGWFPQHNSANYSLYFNSSSYIRVNPNSSASSPNLQNLQDAITISAWFNADDWGGNRRILQKGDSDNQYRILAEKDEMIFEIYNIGRLATTLPSTGTWHHIAGTYDGTIMCLYIDGLLLSKMYASGQINVTDDYIYIGTKTPQAPSGDYFKGYLDDIRIYSVGLTDQQVRTLARQGQNVPPTILEINRRDNLLTALLGVSYLDTVVFDVNNDSLNYLWLETESSPNVSFIPNAFVSEPNVQFSQTGNYSIQLTVNDGNGGISSKITEFSLPDMNCPTVNEMNFHIVGDINYDCIVNMLDLSILCDNWLDNAAN